MLVIEEFLDGEEVSFIGISNGHFLVPFCPSQDHKRAFDNDLGPNTGGMGAYTDSRILNPVQTSDIMERIIQPTLHQMRAEGMPFTGFLYAGLILTSVGPKILEYNVRMGDPETQAIMHSFQGDFLELLNLMVNGTGAVKGSMWGNCSVCLTLAAENYPATPKTGDEITGIEAAEATGATIFHAGTKMAGQKLVTSGGRVLGITASADSLRGAIDAAYAAASQIHFRGMHYRTDIGQKGLRRW
jgi:phosphoribosylamine--glycine ligase